MSMSKENNLSLAYRVTAEHGGIVRPPRHGRFAWICPCNGEGEVFQYRFAPFQTAENLIALIVEAASRIANPVAHFKIYVDLEKEFCMSRETHLAALGQRHDALDKEIAKELVYPAKDELKLAEMKRRKLQLKDEIAKLQCDRSSPSMH
jgi:hypothetical protein